MKTVDRMLIFDVDGVITDPQEKKITEPEILSFIVGRLEKGEPVALNTGRSLFWLINQVINPLLKIKRNKKSLQNFFASGEKGAVWLTINENGSIQQYKDSNISTPTFLQNQIRTLIKTKYSKSMFYDESKVGTLISVEMNDGYSIEEYKKEQKTLAKELQKILVENNLEKILKVDSTTIAVDIENKQVGKGFAINRILKWLEEKEIKPQQFITFGDSSSDIPMAEKLHKMNLKVKLVFVGEEGKLKGKTYPFPVIFTKEVFEKGTLEFLRTL